MHHAVESGQKAIARLLLRTSINTAAADQRDLKRLITALKGGDDHAVRLLLEKADNNDANTYCDPNARTKDFSTPMHFAAKRRYGAIIKLLYEYGANIDDTDSLGSTSLHYAIENDHQEIQEILIDLGANINIKNKSNMSPAQLAWSKKRLDWSAYAKDQTRTNNLGRGSQAKVTVLRKKIESEKAPEV